MNNGSVTPQRILTNQDAVLTLTAYTAGTATDQGTFTVGVVDGNGDTVVAAGTAVTDNSDGTYTYTLSAVSDPTILTVTWTESAGQPVYTTTVEVVGSVLFTEVDARTYQMSGAQTPLASASAYPDADIAEARDLISDQFENKTGRSYVSRYCRIEASGDGSRWVSPRDAFNVTSSGVVAGGEGRHTDIQQVLSCTVNGTAVTASNIKIFNDRFYRTDGMFTRGTTSDPLNVVIEYVYGVSSAEAKQAGLLMLIATLVPSDVPGWASSWTNEDGTFSRTEAGFAYPTKVWEWLKRNNHYLPVA